jgi:hypothetical protein
MPVRSAREHAILLENWSNRLVDLFIRPAYADLKTANAPHPHLESLQFVNSAFDFAVLTLTHIERVARLGGEISERFPSLSPAGIAPHEISLILRTLHDREKLDFSGQFLHLVGWQDRSHPTNHLLASYGSNQVDPLEIEALNRAGEQLRKAFLLGYGLVSENGELNDCGRAYLSLERISDMVDTGMAVERREEFGRPMLKASEILKDPVERDIAEFLEVNYERLTTGFHYVDFRQPLWDLIAERETELSEQSNHSDQSRQDDVAAAAGNFHEFARTSNK